MYTYYTKKGKFTTNKVDNIDFNKLYRENGPTIEHKNGIKEWHKNGELHREGGPAIEYKNGFRRWYAKGKLHRTDGPAVVAPKYYKEWWVNGKQHRLDGPAVVFYNTVEWFINGKKLNTKEVETWIKKYNINLKTKAGQIMFILRFR